MIYLFNQAKIIIYCEIAWGCTATQRVEAWWSSPSSAWHVRWLHNQAIQDSPRYRRKGQDSICVGSFGNTYEWHNPAWKKKQSNITFFILQYYFKLIWIANHTIMTMAEHMSSISYASPMKMFYVHFFILFLKTALPDRY